VTGFIVVANDITKHKEIQAELKKAKEDAEVANATKSAFLANMSHEIRTPLGAVIGFSELLLDDKMSTSERLNSVEVIKRNGRLLSNIINDILDLSKVEAGKLEVEVVDVPFDEVMKEISSILNLEATEKGITLKVTSEGVIPSQIKTDPLRLRQILLNIVGNAIKFTGRGSVHILVKFLETSDARPKLAFIVKDTGEGIRPEHIKRLFTPFTQADVSTTRKFGGTGLGLALSKKLANALGGDVSLSETTVGKGSTFVATIDPGVNEESLHPSPSPQMAKVVHFSNAKRDNDLNQLKVLLVDDSLDNQALIQRVLKMAGATTETANNGKEAVEKAMAGNFDLILMDLQMPEMDGYEATHILREKGYKKPIIALTAHAMKEERQRSLRSGFNDHITKPIDHKFLVRTLAKYAV
jgi:CheY-like chemotaxis protein